MVNMSEKRNFKYSFSEWIDLYKRIEEKFNQNNINIHATIMRIGFCINRIFIAIINDARRTEIEIKKSFTFIFFIKIILKIKKSIKNFLKYRRFFMLSVQINLKGTT